ncbi:MAG: glycerol-3-phosphate 1-O-acyltransferase PlsY [Candidatus Omnitrophota bacterium]
MSSIIAIAASVALSYILGAFPTSYIITKIFAGVDIRQVGSGNAGATNVLRSAGKIPAVITLIIDISKGLAAVTLVAGYSYSFGVDLDYDFYRSLLGFIAICGHIWPVTLKFRGGKGVATTLGVAIGLAPLILLPSLIIWIVVFSVSNYVSLASIIALISFPIIACIFKVSFYIIVFSVATCLLSVYKHKDNLRRLLRGEENKTILFKPK